MEYKDYYKILGVARDASEAEIKKAYRRLARKYHPDVSKVANAEQRFKEINEANAALADPEKRQAYDQLGADWRAGQEFRSPPGWQGRSSGFSNGAGSRAEFSGGDFSDFFETLFGGGAGQAGAGRRGFQSKGVDQQAQLAISLEDAYSGVAKTIRLGERRLQVKIPAGVTGGRRIRLSGQGGAGMGQGNAGDLYLEVQIEPHPMFRLEGQDVLLDVPIAPWEAALGAEVKVPTLGGAVEIKVPKGSKSGRKMRLKGRGLPGSPSGDQYLILQIVAPEAETDEQRALYEKMKAAFSFDPRAHF